MPLSIDAKAAETLEVRLYVDSNRRTDSLTMN